MLGLSYVLVCEMLLRNHEYFVGPAEFCEFEKPFCQSFAFSWVAQQMVFAFGLPEYAFETWNLEEYAPVLHVLSAMAESGMVDLWFMNCHILWSVRIWDT